MKRPFSQYTVEELKELLKQIEDEVEFRYCNSKNKSNEEVDILPITPGQEIEDMIVVDVNYAEGTFRGRSKNDIIWICKIEDYIEKPKDKESKPVNHSSNNLLNSEKSIKSQERKSQPANYTKLRKDANPTRKQKANKTAAEDDKATEVLKAAIEIFRIKHSENGSGLSSKNMELFEEPKSDKTERAMVSVASIRPPGNIRGVPAKMVFPRKSEIKLNLKKDTKLVEKYEVGLKALIAEMRRKGAATRQIALEAGKQVHLDGRELGYQFPYDGEADLFEGARVVAVIHGNEYPGRIVAVMEKQIVISLQDDLGPEISFCILRVDNTAMLEALRERLEKIATGEITNFNTRLARSIITNEGEDVPGEEISGIAAKGLFLRQAKAVSSILSNEVFYLWGPPGTGKTLTLGVLIKLLYGMGKRILLCSNTNQAVDQVLLTLCDTLSEVSMSDIEYGKIVRIGKIAHQKLYDKWSSYITIDGIVEKKSVELRNRKEVLSQKLDVINRSISETVRILSDYKKLDKVTKDVAKLQAGYLEDKKRIEQLWGRKQEIGSRIKSLEQERREVASASRIKRVFMRSQESLDTDIQRYKSSESNLSTDIDKTEVSAKVYQHKIEAMVPLFEQLQKELADYNRKTAEADLARSEQIKQPIINELNDINKQLDDISKTVISQARIVGATVTKAYLSPQLFDDFDVVIVDEASMVILPAIFYVGGLAKEKVIVSGDPFQLPPIVQTEQEELYSLIGRDVFTVAGILDSEKRVVMLNEQYRMDDSICSLISSRIYEGDLRTGKRDTKGVIAPPEPFEEVLTIVDTSTIWPFVSRDPFKSRYNLMNALAIRNLCRFFEKVGFIDSESRVGVCTPYAAQAKVLQRILTNEGLSNKVEAGTIHRYQGDQKSVIILDIPDSWGEQNAGIFLQADNREEDGAKLFNVAVSRTKDRLIVFANLAYLDKRLPQHSILRGILSEMELRGKVIDVRDILALRPITEELRKFGRSFELAPETITTGLFNEKDFQIVCMADMERAKKSIVVFSGFITPQRVASYEHLVRRKISEGVVVRCVTRPPDCNGAIDREDGIVALDALENWGCIVDTRARLHEKAVIIDEVLVWFGSLNPLSHNSKTNEVMARIEGEFLALQLGAFLALEGSSRKDSQGAISKAENPRCPQCYSRTSYRIGQFGPYWQCEKCDWKESLRQPKSQKREPKITAQKAPACPICGSEMIPKAGRYGDFYSCTNFPACKGTVSPKKKTSR